MAKPCNLNAVDSASMVFALVSGCSVTKLIEPFTFGSTKIVCPVAFATAFTTESMSALTNDKLIFASSFFGEAVVEGLFV